MNNNFLKKRKYLIFYGFLVLSVGFLIGLLCYRLYFSCDKNDFKYINPNLACKDSSVVKKHAYAKLKSKLEDYIQEKKNDGTAAQVSIYFRDLQSGPTLGLNEHDLFSPASLLKLPLLLTYYNLNNEKIPDLLERSIVAQTRWVIPKQLIQPKESIVLGRTYSVEDLLLYMIKYSDNNAYYVLLDYLAQVSPERDALNDTFIDLGIVDPKNFLDNTISTKLYGSIFIQLYNSSYFNKKDISQDVLGILTQVDWNKGINRGLPDDMVVAHKFGERSNLDNNLDQLHDCGIVYYPENPYLLCIMTRGQDIEKLPKVIEEISKMFYDEFDSRKL
jgi:beta-lactamase class A